MISALPNSLSEPLALDIRLNPAILALVAEPDVVSRKLICAILESEPDVDFRCIDNSELVPALQSCTPDLVIVDSQAAAIRRTADWESLGVNSPPATIVTSYDSRSATPFASAATDHLIKPFNVEQFENAMEIARSKIKAVKAKFSAAREYARRNDRVVEQRRFLQRFAAESDGRIVLIKAHDVLWLQSFGNHVRVHSAGAKHLVRNTMKNVQSLLDPAMFLRIHRNAIVNLDHVLEFFLPATGNMFVRLDNGLSLPLRRSSRASLRNFLKQSSLV